MDKFFALSEEKQITIINAALQCFGKLDMIRLCQPDIAVTAHISKAPYFSTLATKNNCIPTCWNIV